MLPKCCVVFASGADSSRIGTAFCAAAVALSAGAASFLAGTIWFAHNAANHPRFHRTDVSRSALLRPRLTIQPSLGIASAGILTEIKF